MANIVAITSCPTGIAHTFMAAEGLEQGAIKLGHKIKVETQGSVGAQNQLTADDVAAADIVLIAADTDRSVDDQVLAETVNEMLSDTEALTRALLGGASGEADAEGLQDAEHWEMLPGPGLAP